MIAATTGLDHRRLEPRQRVDVTEQGFVVGTLTDGPAGEQPWSTVVLLTQLGVLADPAGNQSEVGRSHQDSGVSVVTELRRLDSGLVVATG